MLGQNLYFRLANVGHSRAIYARHVAFRKPIRIYQRETPDPQSYKLFGNHGTSTTATDNPDTQIAKCLLNPGSERSNIAVEDVGQLGQRRVEGSNQSKVVADLPQPGNVKGLATFALQVSTESQA
jgi:hypothetical protein